MRFSQVANIVGDYFISMDFFASKIESWKFFCSHSEGGAAGAGAAACIEHAIISGIHLGLIIVFLALALAYQKELRRISAVWSSSCRRRSQQQQQQQRVAAPTRRQQQQQLHWVVVCFMLALGLGYAGSVIWAIGSSSSWSTTSGGGGREFVYPIHELTLLLVQGLAFLCLALSVRVRAMTMTLPQFKTFVRVWWVLAFFLGTFAAIAAAVEVLNGERYGSLAVLELMSWPVCCLLLYCAIKDDDKDDGDGDDGKLSPEFDTLVEPLLDGISEDSEQQPLHNVTPFASAGFLSRMTFWWLNPLLSLGYKRPLEQSDMPSLGKEDEAQTAYKSFAQALEDQSENGHKPVSVFWALTTCYWRPIAVNGLFALGKSITLSLGPVVLKLFIDYTGGKRAFKYEGYILVVGLFLAKSLESISQRQWYFGSRRIGMQVRSALMAAIYRKELKLSNTGKNKHAGGDVVNYMSVDAYRIGEFTYWLHFVWTTWLQILIALVILTYSVGWATLSGLVVIILTMVVNTPMAKSQQKYLTQLMAAQDKRLQATAEALRSMKILKLQAWEDRFKEAIEELRKVEMKWLSAVQYRKAYNSVVFWVSPVLVSTATFFTCMLLGTPLTASNVFTALATLRIVQDPIRLIPDVIAIIIQVHVSLARIDRFLQEDELQADAVARDFQKSSENAIEISNAVLSWEPDTAAAHPTLKDISLQVRHGEHVAVCGEVGSGKSALLNCILGEIPKLSGSVQVSGSIAYVAQSAWIQSGTIQENILFGRPMDKDHYRKTLRACALDKDIRSFPYGDLTEIGERGTNMSGGQKQRIQLARAVYQDADIYLLDDPFSAVDAHTAATLFKDCVMGALLSKTVILVTHQVEFLPAVNSILVKTSACCCCPSKADSNTASVSYADMGFEASDFCSGCWGYNVQLMREGEIWQAGCYDELLSSGTSFKELVNAHEESMGILSDSQDLTTSWEPRNQRPQRLPSRSKSQREEESQRAAKLSDKDIQLTQQEQKEVGNSGLKPYIFYLSQANGFLYFSLAVLAHSVFIVGGVASNWWMASEIGNPAVSTVKLITVYSSIAITTALFVFFRNCFVAVMGLKASRTFFTRLTNSLFHSPMAFFDSTPTGRILSRVASDWSILDIDVAFCFGFAVSASMNALSILVVTCLVIWPILFIIFPMVYINRLLQNYYLTSAREIMRINGTTKAPVVHHFGEAIAGAVTIRAFKRENMFARKNLELIDANASPFFHSIAATEWLIQRLEILSAVVLSASALLIVFLPKGRIDPGFAGLVITYGLSLNVSQVFSVQHQCNLANVIISVERIKQYMNLPSEAPAVIMDERPPAQWPSTGKVELKNLQVRYRPNAPLVLRGITCTFEGGQRVGVVGRTGSGKTTLISSLFRLVEPAGGKILIDGLDITTFGLHDVRSRLGIIPQESTLFRGTVRFNLDPLAQHSDSEIWEVLDKCQLRESIREKSEGLDAPVGEDGENWSVGQRQLFCLGRALLKRSRILVLDEATASIDNTTDAILQHVIRQEFTNYTVITVAHRIPTVIDSDMVLALHDGMLAEYDQPMKLLENSSSLFAKLVAEYWSNTHQTADSFQQGSHPN